MGLWWPPAASYNCARVRHHSPAGTFTRVPGRCLRWSPTPPGPRWSPAYRYIKYKKFYVYSDGTHTHTPPRTHTHAHTHTRTQTARPSQKKSEILCREATIGSQHDANGLFPRPQLTGLQYCRGRQIDRFQAILSTTRGGKQREKTTKTSGWKPQTQPYGWTIIYTVIRLFTHLGNLVSQVKDNIGRHSFASKTRPRQNNIQWP